MLRKDDPRWSTIWETPENDHSATFWRYMHDMANDFCSVLETVNQRLPRDQQYDVKLLDIVLATVRGTVEMYGTGFLPRSFFLSIHSLFDERKQPIDVVDKIKQRNDDYFAETLSAFFTGESSQKFLQPYMDLFHRKDSRGNYLVDSPTRADLWEWIDALFIAMLEYEHSVRDPVVSERGGKRTVMYRLYNEETAMLVNYYALWDVHIL